MIVDICRCKKTKGNYMIVISGASLPDGVLKMGGKSYSSIATFDMRSPSHCQIIGVDAENAMRDITSQGYHLFSAKEM
ncbi:hypothetical protein [Pantoea sp. UYEF8]|uniref:hypothetical protein n=1 Tax=Pantoea sp. UYEF8 TaxID=1756394 RepID=UPI0033962CEB